MFKNLVVETKFKELYHRYGKYIIVDSLCLHIKNILLILNTTSITYEWKHTLKTNKKNTPVNFNFRFV